jgi:hypothetical protein
MNTALLLAPINLRKLWLLNLGLIVLYFSMVVGLPLMKSSVMEYSNVQSVPFDGTTSPISHVPNWLNSANFNKSLRYSDIPTSEFIRVPMYDADVLLDTDTSNKIAALTRGTYITTYMGSYRMNFTEYDGSHVGIDIRAPLGTPVVALANGVVVKVKNTEGSDGKYVIIRHDNIVFDGRVKSSYYSSYLHMDNLVAIEWTAVKKGEKIGEVGLTGITTTPHLHLQIDTAEAPYHVFWPYSMTDLRNLWLDFFEAVNVGLGKELGMKYTVHPMEFIQAFQDGIGSQVVTKSGASAPLAKTVVASPSLPTTPSVPQTYIAAVTVETPVNLPSNTSRPNIDSNPVPNINLDSAPKVPVISTEPPVVFASSLATQSASQAGKTASAFIDVPSKALYKTAAEYLKARSIPELAGETVFRPEQAMTRREAILSLAGLYKIESQNWIQSRFADIPSDDILGWYLETMVARGYVSTSWIFRPNDAITKIELATLIMRIRGEDIRDKNIIQAFALSAKFPRVRIQPKEAVSRADAARMIYQGYTIPVRS